MQKRCEGARSRTRRSCGAAALAVLVGLVAPDQARAQLSDLEQESVETYGQAVRAVESGSKPGGLEAAFYSLGPVREALTRPRDSRWTLIESLSVDEYQRLRRELPGVTMTREELIFVGPDPDYFVKLAETRGDAADRAFFAALKATYPNGVWPVYLEQRTDIAGCTRFGSGTLVATFREWSGFEMKFPGRYAAPAGREVERVQKALLQSTCACGDATSVTQEMDAFAKAFQASSIRASVLERAQALRAGRSDIRAMCTAE